MLPGLRTYPVARRAREPLLDFMLEALRASGCQIDEASEPNRAPFRIVFRLPTGQPMGIVAYAFCANHRQIRNRPRDEHRFQLKYGPRDEELHDIWQDPSGFYTTLLCGINPSAGYFVGVDPVLHSPTRMFISVAFKDEHVRVALERGWHIWERELRGDEPIEILIGGSPRSFLRYVLTEREAYAEDTGHRELIAQRSLPELAQNLRLPSGIAARQRDEQLHALAAELGLSTQTLLDLIGRTPHVKMAVRGVAAEHHLVELLSRVPGVTNVAHNQDGADVRLAFRKASLRIECKNVLRPRTDGIPRVDFQRTRASKADACSRFYSPQDFEIVAACLHAHTGRWEFQFALSCQLDAHASCTGKLAPAVRLDGRWTPDPLVVLRAAVSR